MAEDWLDLAINILASTWAEKHHTGKRSEATKSVNNRGASEVVETAFKGAKPTTSPVPRTDYWISNSYKKRSEDHERHKLNAFSNSP